MKPAISGSRVVVSDYRRGDPDIYMYDLNSKTETRITFDSFTHMEPAISGD